MLRLNSINLTQYKNYTSASFNFHKSVIGICGMNGIGKTNLLDAIYYLCFTKSYLSKSDILNVQSGTDGFRIEGSLTQTFPEGEGFQESFSVVAIFKGAGRKEFLVNEIAYEKFSQHIGKMPCVMIAPDDLETIAGGSEQRRKFMDTVLSEMDANYLQQLITYNKVLQQRNSLLKSADRRNIDLQLLQVLDEQLIQPGKEIYKRRKEFLSELIPLAKKFYKEISNVDEEQIQLLYASQLNDLPFEILLMNSRERDLFSQRSTVGVHKDDLDTNLNSMPFRGIASQGQKKSLLFALKLAEFEILKQNKGFAPLLLLDDVFEKLDDARMQNLLKWVCTNNDGQVFITDTHLDRLTNSLNNFGTNHQIIELK